MHLRPVRSTDEFRQLISDIYTFRYYPGEPDAFGLGIATVYDDGAGTEQILDVNFKYIAVDESHDLASIFWAGRQDDLERELGVRLTYLDDTLSFMYHRVFEIFLSDVRVHPAIAALGEISRIVKQRSPLPFKNHKYVAVLGWAQCFEEPPADIIDAWLRLTLLSRTKMPPNSMDLSGIFDLLPNVAWTDRGPVFNADPWELRINGVTIKSHDKFPPMLDYVIPPGVRVGDASRVRLGAHLAPGTTVMHEGFVNFNAGTLGKSMVEGRISQGVTVGDGSDIGGGASIMGTLSGGGKEIISIGRGCLLGANSGLGISLGDDCVVEAGLYVTAGTKVKLVNSTGQPVVKAATLSSENNLLFRRNSTTGEVEALRRNGASGVELNEALHANT